MARRPGTADFYAMTFPRDGHPRAVHTALQHLQTLAHRTERCLKAFGTRPGSHSYACPAAARTQMTPELEHDAHAHLPEGPNPIDRTPRSNISRYRLTAATPRARRVPAHMSHGVRTERAYLRLEASECADMRNPDIHRLLPAGQPPTAHWTLEPCHPDMTVIKTKHE